MFRPPSGHPAYPSPFRFVRSAQLGRAVLLSATLALVQACGGDPPPPPNDPAEANDHSEKDRIEKSRAKIADANRAYNAKQYDKARTLLKEASALAVESQRYEVTEILEKVDKRQARLFANEAQEKLDQKDCGAAVKDLAAAIDKMKSDSFAKELRRVVGGAVTKCLQVAVDEATLAARYADAKKLVGSPEVKAVLGPTAWKKLSGELEGTLLEALKALVADDLKARRWAAAVDKLDAAVKKGDADDAQSAGVLTTIREAASSEIGALAAKGVGQRDAAATLRQLDALIKTVRWELLEGETASLQKDKALPDELRQKREVLAIWVEGQRVAMKPMKRPEKRWTYGKVAVHPGSKIDGETKRDVAAATEVWVLGLTKEKALVTESDPGTGPLASQLAKVVGWAPLGRLANESTADWLPPDDQLKGLRVWGPLRPPDALMELGFVTDVQGSDVSVKRLADDAVIKVPKRVLRSGRLAPGTKVLTFCTSKDQPAQVQEVLPGQRGVKLKCDGGQEKEEQLSGLRTKTELLPASKEPK